MSQKTFRAFPFFSGSTQYSPSVLKCPAFRISLQDKAGWWEYKPSEKENLYNYVIQFYALRCIPNLEVHTKNTLLLLTVVWLTSFTIVSWVTQSALSLSFLITGNVDTGNLCVWKLSKLHQKTIFFLFKENARQKGGSNDLYLLKNKICLVDRHKLKWRKGVRI